MKVFFRTLIVPVTAAAALLLPAAAFAQMTPAAPPSGAPAAGQHWQGGHEHRGMMRMFESLNLSDQQKTRIEQIVRQFHQAHPRGSRPDAQAREQLHSQIMSVLTPAQQAQLKQEMQRMRGMHDERGEGTPEPQSTPQA